MKNRLNISKDYIIDKTYEESFSQLDTIISTPFNNSKFTTFGNFVSTEPPEFILMAKWVSIGRPILPQIASTKISARLFRMGSKSKISIMTKTNPVVFVFFFFLSAGTLIKLLTYKNSEDLKLSGIYFLFALLTLGFDRFIKNILIASFERDLKTKETT